MIQLSVVVITLNEERNLDRCLRSIKNIADEIVVVDSLSTDNTLTIAQNYNAKIISAQFRGFVEQRKFADEHTSYDWILAIDADEALSPELEQGIISIKKQSSHNAYRIARLNNYCGKWIRHCGWYPDKKLRLYNKKNGSWQGEMIHEHWKLHNSNEAVGEIKGDLLHYTFYTISEHIKQIEKFTEMSARAAVANGKDCSLLKIWFGPKWMYFSMYILKLGFLDGYYGRLLCKFSAFATLIKYTKIRQYAKMKREGKLQ